MHGRYMRGCTEGVHRGGAHRVCTEGVHRGVARKGCTEGLHGGGAQRGCTTTISWLEQALVDSVQLLLAISSAFPGVVKVAAQCHLLNGTLQQRQYTLLKTDDRTLMKGSLTCLVHAALQPDRGRHTAFRMAHDNCLPNKLKQEQHTKHK